MATAEPMGLERCPTCKAGALRRGTVEHRAEVAGHTFRADLVADLCPACDESFVEGPALGAFELAAAAALLASGETCGPALRWVRKSLGLGSAELAGLLGVAPESVSRWEHDARTPEHAVVALLAVLVDEARRGMTTTRDRLAALRTPTALGPTVTLALG